MADAQTDDEPTMEEILASIRRIISDETEDDAAEEEVDEVTPEPEPVAEEAPADLSNDDVDALFADEEPEPEPEPPIEAVLEPEPEPEPVPVFEEEDEDDDVFELTDLAPEPMPQPQQVAAAIEPIVSQNVEQMAAASFSQLSNMEVTGYQGSEQTLEALVRSMLKPMLQGWLDENLPRVVQEAVEREVARIARR